MQVLFFTRHGGVTCCAGRVKADREGRRRQHALALGEGLVQSAVQPSLRKGWRGGVGPPELWQSAIQGSSFLGQQPKSRPLQARVLGNTGERGEP